MRIDAARLGLAGWWDRLSLRERALLGGLAALIAFALLHSGIIRPLLAWRTEARARIAEYDQGLTLLAAAPVGLPPAAHESDVPATTLLADRAAEFGLSILRIEPEGGGASLVLADAAFAEVVGWIEAVEREGGLTVARAQIERRPEPGTVGADLSFRRP